MKKRKKKQVFSIGSYNNTTLVKIDMDHGRVLDVLVHVIPNHPDERQTLSWTEYEYREITFPLDLSCLKGHLKCGFQNKPVFLYV